MTTAGRAALLVAVALAGLLAAYWPTVESIEAIWRRSDTFAHGYLVVPIVLGLAWLRRAALATATPAWPALLLVLAGGFGWTLGRLAGVIAVEQFALYVMVVGTVVTVLGARAARALAFPLGFLVFAVPFGEFLVPVLIDRTADVTVAALQLTGVPVYREGNVLTIPTGRWSVVDACSGVRYLMATVTVGALYGYLVYQGTAKRLAFLAASIVVPIVANWLRAYLIVMLAHLTDNRLATGVDHFVYGWVFFGVVVAALFWAGSFWRDARAPLASVAGTVGAATPAGAATLAAAAALALAAGAAWRPVAAALDAPVAVAERPLPPIVPAAGWRALPAGTPIPWAPHYVGARGERHQLFERDGERVGVYVAFYVRQEPGHELVAAGNALVDPEDLRWAVVSRGQAALPWHEGAVTARATELRARGLAGLATRSWYWVSGRHAPGELEAKALLAADRLTRQPDHSALIVVYTPDADGADAAAARLGRFGAEMGGAVMAALAAASAP